MIFMNFFARSSRTTGPKIRVPIGSICLLISTAALRSKRIALPSARRTGKAVRTTTAWCTSPFFTLPRGIASLMETTITSPTEAVLRLEPPSTLMHCTRRAPELSATSRFDSTIIIACSSDAGRRGGFGDCRTVALSHNPGLALADRRAFFNADQITFNTGIGFVMRRIFLRAANELLIYRMHDATFDKHGNRLVHLVAHNPPGQNTFRHGILLNLRSRTRALSQNCLHPRNIA